MFGRPVVLYEAKERHSRRPARSRYSGTHRFRSSVSHRGILRGMEARQKTSIAMTETTKLKLESLKLRLRKAGIARSQASESAIVEVLVAAADFETLLDRLSR